jgi:hypothetical protein
MRYVVFVCLTVGLLSRPALAQSAPAPAPTQALEAGISVTGVGRVANFTRHTLVFYPKDSRFIGGNGGLREIRTPSEEQAKQIASEVRARQAALKETLEKLKLGKIKIVVDDSADGITYGREFGTPGVRYKFVPDSVYVYLTQTECDGETIGGLSRQKFLEAIQGSMTDFSITLQSSVDSKDEKIQHEATARAIANGRETAKAIASAGGVKLGKLVAAQEDKERRVVFDERQMTLTSEKAIVTQPGGFVMAYALRFSIR